MLNSEPRVGPGPGGTRAGTRAGCDLGQWDPGQWDPGLASQMDFKLKQAIISQIFAPDVCKSLCQTCVAMPGL